MARRVFLHIGVPKTGTTFLQTAMWNNRASLERQGFLYPGSKRMDHYHAAQAVRDASARRPRHEKDAWTKLVQELSAWPGTGLVSHEFFSMATTAQAKAAVAALQPAEVHIVLTVRDYVRQFPAVWQEALKMGSPASLDQFMEKALAFDVQGGAWGWDSQDVPAVLDRWGQAVPAEQVHVITVPPPGAPRPLLWRRWCEVLEVDDAGFDMERSFGNESLGAAQAALLHRVVPHLSGPLGPAPARHRWVRQYFGHEVLVPQRGERFGLRPKHAAELRSLSGAMTEAITQGGYSVVGDLADLVPAEGQPELPYPDDVDVDEVLEVAARAIEHMIRDVRELTTARNRLRRKMHQHAWRRPVALARRLAARVKGSRR